MSTVPNKIADHWRHLFSKKLTLTPSERKILKSPLEILLIYGPDGKQRRLRMGTANKVSIPADTPKDAILSHNHPTGRGPSRQDLKSTLENPGRTLRIVAKNEKAKIEIFSLKALKALSPDEIEDIVLEYGAACDLGMEYHQARRDSLALISETYGHIVQVVTTISK